MEKKYSKSEKKMGLFAIFTICGAARTTATKQGVSAYVYITDLPMFFTLAE